MSVIAKFATREIAHFGTGQLVSLSCWCENDLMAAYATDEQDKLFTKYSPWGEMRINTFENHPLFKAHSDYNQASAFYVVLLSEAEAGEIDANETQAFPGAEFFCRVRCYSVLDLGADSKNVEFKITEKQPHRGVDGFNWKMAVDNPGASDQFHPRADYFAAFYDATKFTSREAIRAAHGRGAAGNQSES